LICWGSCSSSSERCRWAGAAGTHTALLTDTQAAARCSAASS
jgi:hypothetical protein